MTIAWRNSDGSEADSNPGGQAAGQSRGRIVWEARRAQGFLQCQRAWMVLLFHQSQPKLSVHSLKSGGFKQPGFPRQ